MTRTPARHRHRNPAHAPVARSCAFMVESLESRQLLTGYGLDTGSAAPPVMGPLPVYALASASTPPRAAADTAVDATATVLGTPDGSNPTPITPGNTPLSADGTDFGVPQINDTPIVHRFTIRNDGTDPLKLSGSQVVTITGGSNFSVSLDAPADPAGIAPGDSVFFEITYNPTTAGRQTATVTFASNDPDHPTYTFTVAGSALDPSNASRVVVTQGSTAIAGGSSYSFGNVAIGSAPKVVTFTVTNVSASTIAFDPLALASNTAFEIVTSPGTSLAAGESTTFSVRLNATSAGDKTDTVTLTNTTGGDTQTVTFDVAGKITVPHIVVSEGATDLAAGQTVNFGSVVSGQPAVSRTFTIKNTGEAPLNLSSLSLPNGYGFAFTSSSASTTAITLPTTINPGDSITLTVTLNSSAAAGAHNGTLSLATNDPAANPFTLSLTGSVLAPVITVSLDGTSLTSGTAVPFGTVVQKQAAPTKTFTITNSGTASTNITLGTLPSGFTLVSGPASSLAAGASTTFTVQLNTTTAGTPSGSISINSGAGQFKITVSGTVQAISVKAVFLVDGSTVGGQAINFGAVRQSRTAVWKVVTVRNDGNMPLTLGAMVLPDGYTLASDPASTTLAPGATTTFTVAFRPLVTGTQTGVLTIATNETARDAAQASVTATVNPVGKKGLTVDSVAAYGLPGIVRGGTRDATGTAVVRLGNHSKSAIAGNYKITLYAADGTFARPGVDKVIGSASVHLNLPAGGKLSRAVHLAFPAPPADAGYHIVAVVTGAGVDPLHNFNRAPFTVRVEKAQAKIGNGTAGAAPVTATLASRVTQQVPLSNTGNTTIAGVLTAQVWLSKDGTLAPAKAAKITTLTGLHINLAAKGSQKLTISFPLPKALPDGFATGVAYKLLLKVKSISSSTAYTALKKGILRAGKITIKASA